ncbi:MAG: hypothetical protein IJM62_06220 [Lachnospiraceae bacterium]|nr:hypothetical protein [Lachnospiraceae bacterium]
MAQLNEFKVKSFLQHLVPGILALLFGISVMAAIIVELATGYDPSSRTAYIFGIIFTAAIIIFGIYFLMQAVHIHKKFLSQLKKEDRQLLLAQLKSGEDVFLSHSVIVTPDFIVLFERKLTSFVRIYKIEELVACFSKAKYLSSTEIGEYELIIGDVHKRYTDLSVTGEDAPNMSAAYQMILNTVPWIMNNYSDDRAEFMANHKKESYRKACVRTVEARRKNMTENKVTI